MIKANLVKVSGKSLMPLKTLYIYTRINRQNIQYCNETSKTILSASYTVNVFFCYFSFLTYPKKSLILFYVPVTEYIYIGKPNRQNIPVSSYKGNMVMSEAYMCEYLLNKKITKDISLVVFCINSHQIVYIYANQTDRIFVISKLYLLQKNIKK